MAWWWVAFACSEPPTVKVEGIYFFDREVSAFRPCGQPTEWWLDLDASPAFGEAYFRVAGAAATGPNSARRGAPAFASVTGIVGEAGRSGPVFTVQEVHELRPMGFDDLKRCQEPGMGPMNGR